MRWKIQKEKVQILILLINCIKKRKWNSNSFLPSIFSWNSFEIQLSTISDPLSVHRKNLNNSRRKNSNTDTAINCIKKKIFFWNISGTCSLRKFHRTIYPLPIRSRTRSKPDRNAERSKIDSIRGMEWPRRMKSRLGTRIVGERVGKLWVEPQ